MRSACNVSSAASWLTSSRLRGIELLTEAVHQRFAAQLERLTVGQHHQQTANAAAGRTVLQPAAAGGVERDHAAHRRDRAGGGVGAESPPHAAELCVEPPVNQSRLHANPFRVDANQPPQIGGEIDDQSRAERLAGHAGAGPAGVQRQPLFPSVLHAGDHVVGAPRPHDPQRTNLVDAGVAGVELQKRLVAANVARDQSAQIILDVFALLIECAHRPRQRRSP